MPYVNAQEIEGKIANHLSLSPNSKVSGPLFGQQDYIPAVQGSGEH